MLPELESGDPFKALLQQVKKTLDAARKKLEEDIVRAEKGLESPDLNQISADIIDSRKGEEDEAEIYLIYALEAFYIKTGVDLNDPLGAKSGFESEKMKRVRNTSASDEVRKILEGSSQGAGVIGNTLVFNEFYSSFEASFEKELNDTGQNSLILLLLKQLSRIDLEYFTSIVNHELAHLYIQQYTNYDSDKKPLKAIEEAAAMAVTNVAYPEFREEKYQNLNTYSSRGIPKSLLKSCTNAFERLAKGKEGRQQKINSIRNGAVKAIEKAQSERIGIPEAILDQSGETEEEFYILRQLEIAENLTSAALFQMGFITEQELQDWVFELEEEKAIEEKPQRVIAKKDIAQLEEEAEYLEDLDIDLPGLTRNLKVLIQKFRKEERFLGENQTEEKMKRLIQKIGQETAHYDLEREEIQRLMNEYLEYLEAAEKHIQSIIKVTEVLHEGEESLASKIQENASEEVVENLRFLINKTEELHEAGKKSIERIERARKSLEKAERKIQGTG